MGIFDFAKTIRKTIDVMSDNAKRPDSAAEQRKSSFKSGKNGKSRNTSSMPKIVVVEPLGKRSWLYNAENGVKGSVDEQLSGKLTLTVANAKKASAFFYFQDLLSHIEADTIEVRAIDQRKAVLPDDWTYISDDQLALVSGDNIAISLIYKDRLAPLGYVEGTSIRCALSRPPYTDGAIIPSVLMTDEMVEADNRISEEKYLAKISEHSGMHVRDRDKFVCVRISQDRWLDGEYPRKTRYITPEFELVPPSGKSKAKPHLIVKDCGTPLVELTARSSAYKTIADNIDAKCDGRIVYKYWNDDQDVSHLLLVFD